MENSKISISSFNPFSSETNYNILIGGCKKSDTIEEVSNILNRVKKNSDSAGIIFILEKKRYDDSTLLSTSKRISQLKDHTDKDGVSYYTFDNVTRKSVISDVLSFMKQNGEVPREGNNYIVCIELSDNLKINIADVGTMARKSFSSLAILNTDSLPVVDAKSFAWHITLNQKDKEALIVYKC